MEYGDRTHRRDTTEGHTAENYKYDSDRRPLKHVRSRSRPKSPEMLPLKKRNRWEDTPSSPVISEVCLMSFLVNN